MTIVFNASYFKFLVLIITLIFQEGSLNFNFIYIPSTLSILPLMTGVCIMIFSYASNSGIPSLRVAVYIALIFGDWIGDF